MEKTPQVSLVCLLVMLPTAQCVTCSPVRSRELPGRENKPVSVQRRPARHWFPLPEHLPWHLFRVRCQLHPRECTLLTASRSTHNTFTVRESSVVWQALPGVSQSMQFRVTWKSRDITLPTKVHLVKAMVFPVVMYGCESDYKESWVPKNWCFWTVVLEKTLESPLNFKVIQPVNPKGNQSWNIHWKD